MTDTRTIIEMTKGTEEDRMFEGALNSILHMDKKDYPSYVGGLMVASGHDFIVSSPIDESIRFGRFQDPEDGMADVAVGAASEAFTEWSRTDPGKRAGVFEVALDSIVRQRYRLAAAVTVSSGMTRSRALEEVDRLAAVLKREIKKVRSGEKVRPSGVWTIVSEHNSPLAAPAAYAMVSMLAGNTVIMTPSRYAPVPIYMVYDILRSALLPSGVLNIIVDRTGKTTDGLVNNEGVSGIVAVGSGKRMEEMMFLQTDDQLRFVNEMKGMNPVLVSKPSNMAAAVRSVLDNAFSFSGQDTNAASKVVVMADDQKAFTDALMKEVRNVTVGDPVDADTVVGPVISKDAVEEFLSIAVEVGDSIVYGGKRVMDDDTREGHFVRPMIVMGLPSDHELNSIDHGLPILSVEIASDHEEAMEMINGCEFGLFSGIYTKDENISKRFLKDAVADNLYVNDPNSIAGTAIKADIHCFSR